jgi:hypothetical protein
MATIEDFDFSVDLLRALLWQYDSAPRLRSLLGSKQAWYDASVSAFWSNWVRDVFDLTTANDFGLAVWSKILDFPIVAGVPGSGARPVFGFEEFNENFEHGGFGRDDAGVLNLTTEQKRLVLRLRYFQLTTRGSIPEINRILAILFGDLGVAYALDGLDMSLVYVFTFVPPSNVFFVLRNFDLLPRPAGVAVSYVIDPGNGFGFDPYYDNFENGNFYGA